LTAIFLWVILPYIVGAILLLGCLYRFAFRQLTWAAPSTEIYEKKWLRVGSISFHYGIIFAFIGHVMGVLIPREFYLSLGVSDELYHTFAIVGGAFAGLLVCFGLVVLLIRKMKFTKVRKHQTFADVFSVVMVLIVAALGTYMTLIYDIFTMEYEYRTTIGPWFRSLFTFQPLYHLMIGVPTIFKVHIISSFLLFASIPFTRLVHIFSLPIRYPWRAPQQYRSRSNFKR
jgi:nitrate reductase gamma subunit